MPASTPKTDRYLFFPRRPTDARRSIFRSLRLEPLEARRVLAGEFTDISAGLIGVNVSSVAWGDYDNDGDLDILLTGNTTSGGGNRISRVYQNSSGTFSDISAGLTGVFDSSVAWGDYDNDGDLDILLTGDAIGLGRISRVYQNSSGTFSDISAGLPGVYRSSVAWGDYDNDGDLDILLTGSPPAGRMARVYQNSSGTFSDISAGLIAVQLSSVAWGDYDNDGDLDILLTGEQGGLNGISRVYRNTSGTFSDISAGLPGVFWGSVAWGDYDNDGDLDILLTGRFGYAYISRVYQNTSATANSVPAAPSGLMATINSPTSVTLAWTAPSDTQTPSAGLSYNLRVGTTPGGSDVVGPMSFQNPPSSQTDGLRKIAQRGLVQTTSWTLDGLTPGQTYYWSVQAVDAALSGGPFATEQSYFMSHVSDRMGVRRANQFYQDVNGSGQWESLEDRSPIFGNASDTPLIGDWDGDGLDEIGLHRGTDFYLDRNRNGRWDRTDGGDQLFNFGAMGDVPLIGDWNGDGTDEIGVQRGNQFYLDFNGNGTWDGTGGGDLLRTFGNVGDTPLAGDWNGNGTDSIGVHRGNRYYLDVNDNGDWFGVAGGDVVYTFGNSTDTPLAGDWDADGTDEIGAYRGNQFFLDRNGNGMWNSTPADDVVQFGNSTGDLPLIGRWRPLGALLAAGSDATTGRNTPPLTRAALEPIRQHALLLWANTGLNSSQLESLGRVTFSMADLPGAQLGLSLGGTILLDADAAGYGWFIDPTPNESSEFDPSSLPTSEFDVPHSRDLLSAVLHELGHELGFEHDDDIEAMFETLAAGVRRLP